MAITYLSNKMFLSNAAANDVSFGSDNVANAAWSEKPLCLAGKTMVGGSETKNTSRGEHDVWNWNSSTKLWTFKQHLTSPGAIAQYFGGHIAMDKSVLEPLVLVMSAHAYGTNQGRAYVFERPNFDSDFVLVSIFEASDKEANDNFAYRVAVDEENGVIAVGAIGWDGPTWGNVGKIYLYERDDVTGWPGNDVTPGTEDAFVILPAGERTIQNLYLGNGIALKNGHLLGTGRGGAYKKVNYWLRASKTTWNHQQTFVPSGSGANLCDVDMDSSAMYAVVGIPGSNTWGRIVLMKRTGAGATSWTEADELTKTTDVGVGYKDAYFGTVVRMHPNATSVAVSAPGAYWNNGIGRAWLIPIVSDAIDDTNEKIYEAAAPWRENAHYFGSALGWNGSHLAIGACGDDEDYENVGALYQSLEGGDYPSVTPEIISTAGGHRLVLTGEFPEGTAVEAFLGPTGDETDTPCYSGEPGNAYAPVSTDGETLEIVSPPMSKGTRKITVRYGGENYSQWSTTVVERNWPKKLFDTRRKFPPKQAVGPRRLDLETLE